MVESDLAASLDCSYVDLGPVGTSSRICNSNSTWKLLVQR
jgi:hypothetical protein